MRSLVRCTMPVPQPALAEPELTEAKGGDVDYEAFYRSGVGPLRRLAFARTGDWAFAEDLAQDALADAFRQWERISAYEDPLGWARRAVLNRSASRWRRIASETRAMARLGARGGDDGAVEPDLGDPELWVAIRSLPRRQQEVVLLLWFEDLSVDEVAHVIGCGGETVRTHWRRARTRLAEALGEIDDDIADGGAR